MSSNTRRSKYCLAAIVSALVFSVSSPTHGLVSDRVLATVKGEAITFSDYQRFVSGMAQKQDTKTVDEGLLKKIIEEKVIVHEALQRNIEASDGEVDDMIKEYAEENALSQDELQRELAKNGMNAASFRKLMKDKIISQKLIVADVDSKIIVTDKEIEAFYNGHKKDYLINPEKVEVKAIFLKLPEAVSPTELTDMKRRALWIEARLKNGESFDALCEKYSDEPLRSQGGRLGEFTRGAIIPPIGNKAFSMKRGEISESIWLPDGAYILYLVNKTDENFRPLREVSVEIRDQLVKQKRERVFNEWMRTLWDRASVTIK